MLAIHRHKAQQAPLPTLPPPQPAGAPVGADHTGATLGPGLGASTSAHPLSYLSRVSHRRARPMAHHRALGGRLPTAPCRQMLGEPAGRCLLLATTIQRPL